ncbi:hypothetical protein KKH39_02035 [Patescibacteria group bacterium]|nr:hypothetical protein [Patescibacteria group bacterium]
MENSPWYLAHLWVIGIQVIAFLPYLIASVRFYQNKGHFMLWLTIGICLDIVMAVSASSGSLPRMNSTDQAPWHSLLFITHISLAGIGLFGFFSLFLFLIAKGTKREYPRLRKFQFKFLLTCWIIGVGIALVNFASKVIFDIRLYDLI